MLGCDQIGGGINSSAHSFYASTVHYPYRPSLISNIYTFVSMLIDPSIKNKSPGIEIPELYVRTGNLYLLDNIDYPKYGYL